MGKPTGFLEYGREVGRVESPEERLRDWNFTDSFRRKRKVGRGPGAWTAAFLSARRDCPLRE